PAAVAATASTFQPRPFRRRDRGFYAAEAGFARLRSQTRSSKSRVKSSWREKARRTSGGFDLEDLELERTPRRRDLDDVALLLADDRLADRRLVGELVLGRVRLGGADDVVLDRLVLLHVLEAHPGSDRDHV